MTSIRSPRPRRAGRLVVVTVAVLSLGLAACSGNGDSAAPRGDTRTFIDVTGASVEVPDVPRRIVAIHDINAGAQLLSLGAPVVGIATRDDGPRSDVTRYFDLDGIEKVGLTYEPNVEAIAALEPDLIVGEGFDGKGMDQFMDKGIQESLERIAPVVYIDTFRPVEAVMADFEALVGDAATTSVDDQAAEFASVLEDLRGILGDGWSAVAVSAVFSGEPLSIPGPADLVETDILGRVGVTFTDVVQESDDEGGFMELSSERIPELEADLLVVTTAFDQSLLDSPLYQALAVVRAGQVYEIDEPSAGTHWLNYTAVARDLVTALQGANLQTGLV
jgi:iron complex transport system substrate-binding protein